MKIISCFNLEIKDIIRKGIEFVATDEDGK